MEPGSADAPGLSRDRAPPSLRILNQIKPFARFLEPRCTQSQAVSIGEFASAAWQKAPRARFARCQIRESRRVVLFRGAETHTRSILKAVSWRTLGTLDTFAISWLLTGRVEIAGSIAGLEVITKVAWYYLHERVWAAIRWGRRPQV
jgi:uncharacterized membrane protein